MKKKALTENLQQQLSKTQTELEKNAANNSQQLNAKKKELEGQTFSYKALMRYPDRIYYMTGLSLSELDFYMNVWSLSCTQLFILIVTMTTRPILESWTQRQNLLVS